MTWSADFLVTIRITWGNFYIRPILGLSPKDSDSLWVERGLNTDIVFKLFTGINIYLHVQPLFWSYSVPVVFLLLCFCLFATSFFFFLKISALRASLFFTLFL